MKGLKLHPAAGFHLEDNDSMILLEKAAEFDVPVIVHTGQAFGPLLSKHCQPTGVDEVLARLPGIRLIAAHMGGGWFEELCWTGYVKRNLYTDISLWQIRCRQNFKDFAGFIRKALDMLGIDHVLFGTDWPFTASVINPKAYVQAIEQFANTPAVNVSFAKAEIKAILGKNAAVLLKLGAGYGNQEI
jgi:predicted TIM-barrel fold metal-dependent hydrolase